MNITEFAQPDNISVQQTIASYNRDEVFTFSSFTTDAPVYQFPKPEKKVVVNGKYTFICPDELTVKTNDEVICEAANGRLWIGTVTNLESNFAGNCKKVVAVVTSWSFNRKLLFKLREDLRQEMTYIKSSSLQPHYDILAYLDGMKSKIQFYRIDEEVKIQMIRYLTNYVQKDMLKEAA